MLMSYYLMAVAAISRTFMHIKVLIQKLMVQIFTQLCDLFNAKQQITTFYTLRVIFLHRRDRVSVCAMVM